MWGQTILEVQHEKKESVWVNQEGTYKKNIQEYTENKKRIKNYSPLSRQKKWASGMLLN